MMKVIRPFEQQSLIKTALKLVVDQYIIYLGDINVGVFLYSYTYMHEIMCSQPLPDELERTAAEGILVCLDDTIKSIQENQVRSNTFLEKEWEG